MARFDVYLNFSGGTTEPAFNFYEKLFRAERQDLIRYSEMTQALETEDITISDEQANFVAHAALRLNNMILMGTDDLDSDTQNSGAKEDSTLAKTTLVYDADSEADADRVFTALSQGGTVTTPLAHQEYGVYDGRCIDRFGVAWEVMYEG